MNRCMAASSHFNAIPDDTRKDNDNLQWLHMLGPDVQWAWLARLKWIRWLDRAAEDEMMFPERKNLSNFISARDEFDRSSMLSGELWERYIYACRYYHLEAPFVRTWAEYEAKAYELSGTIFQ